MKTFYIALLYLLIFGQNCFGQNNIDAKNISLDSIKLLIHQGNLLSDKNENNAARIKYEKVLNIYKNNKSLIKKFPEPYVDAIRSISHSDMIAEHYDKAIKRLYEILITLNDNDIILKREVFLNLGYAYWYIKDYKEAESFFRKGLKIKSEDEKTTSHFYTGLADAYFYSNLDSSYYYYKKANTYLKENALLSEYHFNNIGIGEIYTLKGEYKKARKILNEAKDYYEENGQIPNPGFIYFLLAKLADKEGEVGEHYFYLNKAKPMLEKSNQLFSVEELYEALFTFHKNQEQKDSSHYYSLKLKKVRDSIHNKEKRNLVNIYKIKYLNELHKTKINAQQLLIDSQRKQRNWLILGIFLVLSLLTLTYVFYRKRLYAQKALYKKKDELASEKINTLIETLKTKSMHAHLEGQNKERKRIAKDLHDSISGNLAAIKIRLSNINEEHQTDEIRSIISNVDTTYSQVRAISHNLLSQNTPKLNFVGTLHELIDLYKSDYFKLTLNIFPEEEINTLDNNIQIEIYRILQELITNIVKHAQASKGLINITQHDNYLNVLVEDNGVGFIYSTKNNGIGLKNIKSRVALLNGNLNIDSYLNKGTTISINFSLDSINS